MTLENTKISVVIPVSERVSNVAELYQAYKQALESMQNPFDITYILDGDYPEELQVLTGLQAKGENIKIIKLAKWFGEAIALNAGFDNTDGEVILTLPSYYQVEPVDIPKLISELQDCHMTVAVRWPRIDASANKMQSRAFHWIVNKITDSQYRDLGCGARAFHRQVIEEVPIYGDQHRFLPLLAEQRGFNVKQVELQQSKLDEHRRIYKPGIYLRRIIDILTVFFLVKFTKKPLRFFGLVGSATFLLGGILLAGLVLERLIGGVALADRPALLLSSLLVVLGVQLFALGLIGELIIFTHAKDIKEYTIEEIVNRES
ncbi:MAG: glycosyltransferase [Thiohalomonadales bacterium]